MTGIYSIRYQGGYVEGLAGPHTFFVDSEEHFDSAFRRLLNLSRDEAERFILEWVRVASQADESHPHSDEDRIALLRTAWLLCRPGRGQRAIPDSTSSLAGQALLARKVWADTIGDDDDHMLVGSTNNPFPHGWLVDKSGLPAQAPEYEENYFEGEIERVGYGSYREQGVWRMQKARRQARRVEAAFLWEFATPPRNRRVLDVGCGYGYFRRAMHERGWRHDGVELSAFAVRAARESFGYNTLLGTLEDAQRPEEGYTAIAMWDFIEHVQDPDSVLSQARDLLADDGLLFIRTPNLLAAEAAVFGSDYHSLKLEHLHIFSPASLAAALVSAGLTPTLIDTESHLLAGFVGNGVHQFAASQRGSDIFCAARRAS